MTDMSVREWHSINSGKISMEATSYSIK